MFVQGLVLTKILVGLYLSISENLRKVTGFFKIVFGSIGLLLKGLYAGNCHFGPIMMGALRHGTGFVNDHFGQAVVRGFRTTHWSVVLKASESSSPHRREALSSLCETYWYPLYSYARQMGRSQHDAQDLTQEFFAELFDDRIVQRADPERGRFRSFLMTAFKRFIAQDYHRQRAQKRGSGKVSLSLNYGDGEQRFLTEPSHNQTAERIFQKRWALALLDRVFERLRERYREIGQEALFEALKGTLVYESSQLSHKDIAQDLGMKTTAVKVALHRLRQRYGQVLRQEVLHTLESPADLEDEIRELLKTLAD